MPQVVVFCTLVLKMLALPVIAMVGWERLVTITHTPKILAIPIGVVWLRAWL